MKVTLIHNPQAGDGQDAKSLIRLIEECGHDVRHGSIKEDWKELLEKPADLIVAAGGDGTVRKVLLATAKHGKPFAAIPIGTANNIAKTIGVLGSAEDLIDGWSSSRSKQPLDLGEVEAPWGAGRFVEGVGGGLLADLISREDEIAADATLLGHEIDRALHLLCDLVRDAKLARWHVHADGKNLSGDYFAVEVLNMRFVGPNLPLAAGAFPGDGLLDLVLLAKEHREPLVAYLEERQHMASASLPEFKVVRAREVAITAPAGVRWHLDDKNWPSADPPEEESRVTVRCLPGAATFIAALKAREPVPH
jgi:diacylglycerol kinase family enzyme